MDEAIMLLDKIKQHSPEIIFNSYLRAGRAVVIAMLFYRGNYFPGRSSASYSLVAMVVVTSHCGNNRSRSVVIISSFLIKAASEEVITGFFKMAEASVEKPLCNYSREVSGVAIIYISKEVPLFI